MLRKRRKGTKNKLYCDKKNKRIRTWLRKEREKMVEGRRKE